MRSTRMELLFLLHSVNEWLIAASQNAETSNYTTISRIAAVIIELQL